MVAAEHHIGTEITNDKQAACVVTEHIFAFIFFSCLDVCNDTNNDIYFSFSVLGVVEIYIDLL